MGVNVKDTIPEINTQDDNVMAKSRKIDPSFPFIKTTGINTQPNVIVITIIGTLISSVPSIAASCQFPLNLWIIFSKTTIASSTTNPIAIVNAISVDTLIGQLNIFMGKNVPISEIGIANIGVIDALADPKKHKIIRIIKIIASNMFVTALEINVLITLELSSMDICN
jgi:hypothetical protein